MQSEPIFSMFSDRLACFEMDVARVLLTKRVAVNKVAGEVPATR